MESKAAHVPHAGPATQDRLLTTSDEFLLTKRKIQTLLLLQFNSGCSLSTLPYAYIHYFKEELGFQNLGFESLLGMIRKMKPQVYVPSQGVSFFCGRRRDIVIKARNLTPDMTMETLMAVFPKDTIESPAAAAPPPPPNSPPQLPLASLNAQVVQDLLLRPENFPEPAPSNRLQDDDDERKAVGSGFVKYNKFVGMAFLDVPLLGEGRHGRVMKAKWDKMFVAAKVYDTTAVESWERERAIYESLCGERPNILGYLGADFFQSSINTDRYFLIVCKYHRRGSLANVLEQEVLFPATLLRLTYSLTCAVAFLHLEYLNCGSHRAIAHRDIKTDNILVSLDTQCVLFDFGHSVMYDSETQTFDLPPKAKVQGTRRYMAPEILDQTLDERDFEQLKRTDVYSLALCFWEMISRTQSTKAVKNYQRPYTEEGVGKDPTFEDVKNVVCAGLRPKSRKHWEDENVMNKLMTEVVSKSWCQRPEERLTASLIKNNIEIICKKNINRVGFHGITNKFLLGNVCF